MLKIARGHDSEFVIARDEGVKSSASGVCPDAEASAYCAVRVASAPCETRPDRSAAFIEVSA